MPIVSLTTADVLKELAKPPKVCPNCKTEDWADAKECSRCFLPYVVEVKH